MKKAKVVLRMLAALVLTVVGISVFYDVSVTDIYALVASFMEGAGGVSIAMAFPASMATGSGKIADETVTTEKAIDESENLLRPDISQKITKIMPSAVPLDTLIRQAGAHEKTSGLQFKFYSSELRPFTDELENEFDDGSAGAVVIKPKNIHAWQVDDGVLFHGITGADGRQLVGHIIAKDVSGGTATLLFLNGEGTNEDEYKSTIPANTKLGRLGNSKSELDAKTDPYGHLPLDEFNYTQQHMQMIRESVWQKMHAKEVKWDIRDMQAMSIYDMRCMMEATSFFGVRKKVYDPLGQDYKYFSGGATRFIDKVLYFDPTEDISNEDFQNWTKQIFVGNAGSDRRYAFVGSDLMERLGVIDLVSKQIDGKSTEVVYGITFNKIETNFGILMLKHHTLFNDYNWADGAVVLDLNHVRKRVWDPMRVRKLDLMITGEKRANALVLEENFGLEFRYPDTHALIMPSSEY